MQIFYNIMVFSIILERNLIVKASSEGSYLNALIKSKEILEGSLNNSEKNSEDELTRSHNDKLDLIKDEIYFDSVKDFIINLKVKIEKLSDENYKTEGILDFSSACLEKVLCILNYIKLENYNIGDRIALFFKNTTFTNSEFYSLNHLFASYDSVLLAELKALELVKANYEKKEEIFAKMDALTDSERTVINFKFLIIILSDKWSALKKNLKKINIKDAYNFHNLHDQFNSILNFIKTAINDNYERCKKLKEEGCDKKQHILKLFDHYDSKEEYERIVRQNWRINIVRDKIKEKRKDVEKVTDKNSDQFKFLKRLIADLKLEYLLQKGFYDSYEHMNDMNYFLFKFEDLNEKFYDCVNHMEGIHELIFKFYSYDILKNVIDKLDEKLVCKVFDQ